MTRVFTFENPHAVASRPLDISYRYRCHHCEFVVTVKSRDEIPEKCPECQRVQGARRSTEWMEKPREE